MAQLRLQEIHAQMYLLSEEAKAISGFLTLREEEEKNKEESG